MSVKWVFKVTETIKPPPSQLRPKVSVCIATYNQRSFISDCLMSALMQTCEADLEILVGDDCSTDGSRDVIRAISDRYPGRITILPRTTNLGPSKNYQNIISHATGDYIAHLDGDDYWAPGKLAVQLEFFKRNPDCVAVYTNACVINREGELIATFSGKHPEQFDTSYLMRGHNFLNHSSMLYRAELRDTLTSIDGEFIDYRIHIRLSCRGDLGFINQNLVVYRAGIPASTSNGSLERIRELYWESLCDSVASHVASKSIVAGKASLIGGIFYESLKRGRLSYAVRWANRARQESSGQSSLVILRSLGVMASLAGRSLRFRVGEAIAGRKVRIAHEQ